MKKAAFFTACLMPCIVLFGIRTGPAFAGTTGKITGVIKDQTTRLPLISANVLVMGTSLGAVTEPDGNFTIINCPPGIYSLRVTMMGYKRTIIKDVRVSMDLTTTMDANLEPTVIEGETVSIVSERPLIRKDMTGSLAVVGADEIKTLPVDNIQDILTLKAGVTERDGKIHIRGGRGGEVAYWVDGMPMTTSSRDMGINVENAAVQELQVVSGTFNAEYGKAMSGIVNIVTKEGQEKYAGAITGYAESYASWDKNFGNLKRVDVVTNPSTGALKGVGVYEYPIRSLKPSTYDIQPMLSGPVPYTRNKLTFFANARLRSWQGWEYGRRWWTPIGWPGDSAQVLLNENKTNSAMAKLAYRLNAHVNLKYQLLFDNGKDSGVERGYTYTPDARNHWKSERWNHMFFLNHVLSQKTFYELRIGRYYRERKDYMLEDPLASCTYLVKVYKDTTQGFMEDEIFDYTQEPERLQQAINLRRQFVYITNPNSPQGYVNPDSTGVPIANSFNRAGYPNLDLPSPNDIWRYNTEHEGNWLGKLDLTSQLTRVHQVKAGFEAKLTEVYTDQFNIVPKMQMGASGNLEAVVPYEPAIPSDTTLNRNTYTRKPKEFSVYVQDKIELKDLVVNVGVRYDYFDANSFVPADSRDPNIYFPMKPEHRYKDYVAPDPNLTAPEREEWMKRFTEYTPAERRAFMQKKVKPVYAISPRLGFSFPITDRGIIHFCYGHFFAMPDLSWLYRSPDFRFSQGGGLSSFGNPALKPERTIQYEIGLQQQLSQNLGMDVTLFYRDIRDWTGAGPKILTVLPSITYSMMENKDYANVRGVTVSLTKRQSNHISAGVDYTFQYAEGTYTNPYDAFTALQNNAERRIALIPMGYDQRHTLNANVNFSFVSWNVTLLGQYRTGNPYTPTFRSNETTGGAPRGTIPNNSEYRPSVKNVDLYIDKRLPIGGLDLNLFAKVYNLFDIRNETDVFTDTGSASYTTTVDPAKQPYSAARVGTVEENIRRPYNFSGPRRVQVGMTVGF